MNEEAPVGDDFLAQTCLKWEKVYQKYMAAGIPTSILRVGVVLDKNGGIFPQLQKSGKFGLGIYFENGQSLSWIHVDDLCEMFLFLLNDKTNSIFNATAENVTYAELTNNLLAGKGGLQVKINVPKFLIKILLGEKSNLLLQGPKIDNRKIKNYGFKFKYESLYAAINQLLNN